MRRSTEKKLPRLGPGPSDALTWVMNAWPTNIAATVPSNTGGEIAQIARVSQHAKARPGRRGPHRQAAGQRRRAKRTRQSSHQPRAREIESRQQREHRPDVHRSWQPARRPPPSSPPVPAPPIKPNTFLAVCGSKRSATISQNPDTRRAQRLKRAGRELVPPPRPNGDDRPFGHHQHQRRQTQSMPHDPGGLGLTASRRRRRVRWKTPLLPSPSREGKWLRSSRGRARPVPPCPRPVSTDHRRAERGSHQRRTGSPA